MGTMNKKDWDAAFPETPDVVRHAVYSAFREGKKRDRRRRHLTQAAAIAATLVVMLGLGMLMRQAGLGAKRNVLTRNDSLPQVSASAQPGESGMTALPAATQTATPEPTAAPTDSPTEAAETVSPEPTVSVTTLPPEMENGSAAGMPESSVIYDDGETVYFPNLSGIQYYHASEEEAKKSLSEADADCVILENSRSTADSIGLWACPDCLFDPSQVYLADGGKTYHRDPHCEGGDLRGTHGCSLYEALLRGLSACEQCAAAGEVFISPYQLTLYHSTTACMRFAKKSAEEFDTLAEDQALYNGMLPCEECLGADYSVLAVSDWQRIVASGSVCAYQAGGYYHLDKTCAPVDAEWMLLGRAICSGLKPCPDCVQIYSAMTDALGMEGGVLDIDGFYFTERGTYYHTEPHCSGMRNANNHTLSLALASGKKPCPVCYPYNPTSQDSVSRYAMNVFSGCFGADYPFERNVEQEQTGADVTKNQLFCNFYYAHPSAELSDRTDGIYINVDEDEVMLLLSLWDAKRMQNFIEQWKNTDLKNAYEQVFTQVSAGSNTSCRLYGIDLTATLGESRYAPALDQCTFYFLMTNPSTNFRAAVEVTYSISNQRLTTMNWQYE